MIEALARPPSWPFPSTCRSASPTKATTSYVDMRSASRYGRHDLGDNAARIADFLSELDAQAARALAGIAPPAETAGAG